MFQKTCGVALASFAFLVGCGGADGEASKGEGNAADVDGELARVKQAVGEPGCGTVAADVTMDMSTTGLQNSPNTYGHPGCPNGFVADLINPRPGVPITGGFVGRVDPLSCLFFYGYVSLWEKQGTSYVKLQESAGFGKGSFCSATGTVTIPAGATGQYRVVSSAGWLFGLVPVGTYIDF